MREYSVNKKNPHNYKTLVRKLRLLKEGVLNEKVPAKETDCNK